MEIIFLDFVEGARAARGIAVIIDVFRAFSVACYAFANGARAIVPVGDVEEARALRLAQPDWLAIGERHARKLEGFDFGNSPTEIEHRDLTGRTLIHTTHAGTQGLVNATGAQEVLTGSLVNAGAVCRYIAERGAQTVSLVRMGHEARERCEEDDLCAELMAARLRGEPFDTGSIRSRLRNAAGARKFFDPQATWAPARDFDLCTEVDRFDFVLRLTRGADGRPRLERVG